MSKYIKDGVRAIFHPKSKTGYIIKNGNIRTLSTKESQLLFFNRSHIKPEDSLYEYVDKESGAQLPTIVTSSHHLKTIQYELNLQCNLQCSHCYCESSPTAYTGLSTDQVLDIVQSAADAGVIHMYLTGGEPLIRKDIFTILERVHKLNIIPTLFSNSTLINESNVRKLVTFGVQCVNTSLDGDYAELHDEIRGQRGAFRKALRGIELLKDAGIRVVVNVCLSQQNFHRIRDIVSLLEKLDVEFEIDRVVPTGRSIATDNAIPTKLFFEEYIKALPQSRRQTYQCNVPKISQDYYEPHCGVGSSYAFIKSNGEMILCPTMGSPEGFVYENNNASSTRVIDIWESNPTFQQHRNMQCHNISFCPAAETCRGGCRSNAAIVHGSVDHPDEFYCNFFKNPSDKFIDAVDLTPAAIKKAGESKN